MASEGYDVSPVQEDSDGDGYGFGFSLDGDPEPWEAAEELDAAGLVYDSCLAEAGVPEIEEARRQSARLTGAERDAAMVSLVACMEAAGVVGLSVAETDSTVFVREWNEQISAGDSGAYMQAQSCFDRYRNVWPEGDPNNP